MRRGGSSSGQVIVAKLPEHLSIRKVTSMPSLRRKERCGRSVRTRYSAAPLTDEMVLYHEEGAFDRWDGGERTEKQEWSAEGCFRTTACTLAEGHKIFFWMKKSMRKQARPTGRHQMESCVEHEAYNGARLGWNERLFGWSVRSLQLYT